MLTHPDGYLEARQRHYQRFFGPVTQGIMHSTDEKPVHVDIYQFEPTSGRDHWTLITSGMSNERQIEPEECTRYMSPRAEIMMYVREPKGWMFNVLKGLAELPFVQSTFLHWLHTVSNETPMTAQPSLLTASFFLPPYLESTAFTELVLDEDRVDFLLMVPITEAERAFAARHGSEKLVTKFEEAGLSPIVDESRASLV